MSKKTEENVQRRNDQGVGEGTGSGVAEQSVEKNEERRDASQAPSEEADAQCGGWNLFEPIDGGPTGEKDGRFYGELGGDRECQLADGDAAAGRQVGGEVKGGARLDLRRSRPRRSRRRNWWSRGAW